MNKGLAIIGVAEVPTRRDPERTRWDILLDVCMGAVRDAGIGKDDIGAVISVKDAETKLTLVLDAPNQQGLKFVQKDHLIGFVIWADMGDHIFIRDYLIDAAHRRRGLGASLFARLRAEHFDTRPLRLEASADHSLAFWKAQGFHAWNSGMRTDALVEHD